MSTFPTSEFGSMQFNGSSWRLERPITFNGVAVAVEIEPEDADTRFISPVQEEALRLLFSLPPDVLEQAAPVVVQNYEVYHEMIGDEEDLPSLNAPIEVWQTVEPAYFSIPAHGDHTVPTFFLNAECGWDPEHGLEVRFRNGQADAASQQGEIGLED